MRLSRAASHAIAAERALGTLGERARRRFEEMARGDAALAAIAQRWDEAFAPLAERVLPVEPPARVWRAIEARIAPRTSAAGASPWRAFGLVSAGLAAVFVAAFLWLAVAPRGDPLFVAVLSAPDAVPRMVVSMHAPDVMRVRIVKPWANVEGKGLELWVLPKDGKPRSLGLVANTPGETLIRVAASDPRVQGINALALSLEPAGGSPTGQPTGPVLCSGVIAPVKKA